MKPILRLIAAIIIVILQSSLSYSQCDPGQIALTMNLYVDGWGQENYWEIVPMDSGCGNATIAWGGNSVVGCDGIADNNANDGYADNTMVTEGPFCITDGEYYDIIFVDSYGDGGLGFELFENGSFAHQYSGSGHGNIWTIQAGVSGLPVNDSPCGALQITPNGPEVEMTNSEAVTQNNEPHPGPGGCGIYGFWCDSDPNITNTVWAFFIAEADVTYEITTCNTGPGFDSQLALYSASQCDDFSTFQLITSNDDTQAGCSSANGYSSLMYASCLNAGEVYYIQLDGWAGATGTTNITVSTVNLTNQLNANVNSINCPLQKGQLGSGSIIPYFTASDANFTSLWTGPNGFTSSENYIYNLESGNYNATITSSCGQVYSQTFTVSQPEMWNVALATVGPDCEASNNGTIATTVTGASAPYTYNWTGPNNFISQDQNLTGLANGTYDLTITDNNNCTFLQTYSLNPINDFAFSLGNDTTICVYNDIVVVAPLNMEYSWQDGSVNQFFQIVGEDWGLGTHYLILTGTNSLGCSYSATYQFVVDACAGVEELNSDKIQIYPNPVSDRLTVNFNQTMTNVNIDIFDASGRTTAAYKNLGGKSMMVMPDLAPGYYIVRVQSGEKVWMEEIIQGE